VGTACDCLGHFKTFGCWRVCSTCHRWLNVHTHAVYEASDFHEVRPGT
jgi:hypothetical protein